MSELDLSPDLAEKLYSLSKQELSLLEWKIRWSKQARPKQLAPPGDTWLKWGILAGRGFGKTLTGANWIGIEAASDPGSFNAVIAPTLDDVRYTCFEGPAGILAVMPECLVNDYNKSSLILYLWNGSVIRGFGSERPDKLRGPQHHRVWGDELAAWTNQRETYDMMKFGLRLGDRPRFIWTTTPKPLPLVKELLVEAESQAKVAKLPDGKLRPPIEEGLRTSIVVRGTTYENRDNLAKGFFEDIAKYEGTKLGRQELHGELIDPEESGIVKRSQWKMWPASKPLPRFIHILMSLDTAYTEKTFDKKDHQPDPSACEVWGLFQIGPTLHVMLLDAWDDYLGLPALIKKVKDESRVTYGEVDRPLLQRTLVPSPYLADAGVRVGKSIDVTVVEDKGSGISLRQMLQMENLLLEPYNPGRADKLARVHAVTPMFAHGRVWAVESAQRPGEFVGWADKVISQVCSYFGPGTVDNDDYVDAMSQALNYFMRKFVRTFEAPTEEQVAMARLDEEREEARGSYLTLPSYEGNPYG